jgi:hypothetical protein
MALERERLAGRARAFPRPLLFNTWIGLVHHYLVNRDVFAHGDSVIGEMRETLIDHFLSMVAA